jgi:hypothetical protein
MNDREVRLECLRMAISAAMAEGNKETVPNLAEQFFYFVWHGPAPQKETE